MSKTETILSNFENFVRMVFRGENDGRELGREPYIGYLCHKISEVKANGARLVINLPPRHLKTTIGSVGLSAWLLGLNPAEKILIVTYSAQLATEIGYRIRQVIRSGWYREHFATRLAPDRTSVTDFGTTAGGGVYAASIDGSFIGRGATVIIFDDPLDMDDASNDEKRDKVNRRFDTAIMSRLNDPTTGRVIVNAHRLHEHDLSGFVLKTGGWSLVGLPFIAPQDASYQFGTRLWHRKAGELLRPDAFSQAEVDRIKQIIHPDFECLYQQLVGATHSITIDAAHFGKVIVAPKDAAVVISVDPGHRGGAGHSFTVMQAWSKIDDNFVLLDQWRAQADIDEIVSALIKAVGCCRPGMVLIEHTGFGQALARDVQRRFPRTKIRLISPDQRSKSARLLSHIHLIEGNRIKLAQDAWWHGDFVEEFVRFPNGNFDDQVDAFSLAMDFFAGNPALEAPKSRALGGTLNSRGMFTPAGKVIGASTANIFCRRKYHFANIFPFRAQLVQKPV
jgi:predicted phage terminase large subunit-like protein